jgi:hypothetical protein
MRRAQDAGILSAHGFKFSDPARLMQIAAKAEADPEAGKRSA